MMTDHAVMMEDKSVLLRRNLEQLPGLDCGLCGYKTCQEFAAFVTMSGTPEHMKRCVNLMQVSTIQEQSVRQASDSCEGCTAVLPFSGGAHEWKDFLGRDYDFVLSLDDRIEYPLSW